jgi:hypothetical protein
MRHRPRPEILNDQVRNRCRGNVPAGFPPESPAEFSGIRNLLQHGVISGTCYGDLTWRIMASTAGLAFSTAILIEG